jgi:photosystem II stability/assembly factor-like uncharacterized protein
LAKGGSRRNAQLKSSEPIVKWGREMKSRFDKTRTSAAMRAFALAVGLGTLVGACGSQSAAGPTANESDGPVSRSFSPPPSFDPPTYSWQSYHTHVNPGSAIEFVDESSGWRLGGQGGQPHLDQNLAAAPIDTGYGWPGEHLLATDDGGTNWRVIFDGSAQTNGIWGFDLLSRTTGWVIGVTGAFATTDAGQSWQQITEPAGTALVRVDFVSATIGWGLTTEGGVVNSVDGGQTWTTPAGIDAPATSLCATQANAYVVDESGNVAIGSDGTWQVTSPTPAVSDAPTWSQVACNGNAAWVSNEYTRMLTHDSKGRFYTLLHTDDAGATWQTVADTADSDPPSPTSGPDVVATVDLAVSSADSMLVGFPQNGWALQTQKLIGGELGQPNEFEAIPQQLPYAKDAAIFVIVQGAAVVGDDAWILLTDDAVGDTNAVAPQTLVVHSDDAGKTWAVISQEHAE